MKLLSEFFLSVQERTVSFGSQDAAKRAAAGVALSLVQPGMRLGLGTGSTVEFFLQGLAEKVRDGLSVVGVPTSKATERRARELGIELAGSGSDFRQLATDLCVDGADRVEPEGALIKGGGGALLREKLVAENSQRVCIMVDSTKLVPVFDDSFALPVECVPFGIENTLARLASLGGEVSLRSDADKLFITDNGNYIADCIFTQIHDPVAAELSIKAFTGVVEVGIFSGLLDSLVVGFPDGESQTWNR